MIEHPAKIQFITEATVTPLLGIMNPIYAQTLDPKVAPKVNINPMMAMQLNNKIASLAEAS
jgi:hypothetical protein